MVDSVYDARADRDIEVPYDKWGSMVELEGGMEF